MKQYQAYLEYKPSGIEWLDDIPKHWETKRLGYLASKIGSGKTPRGGAESYQKEGVLLIRSQNVYDDELRLNDAVFIDDETDDEMAGTRVFSGDVLLNITGASLGRCTITPQKFQRANVNQHVCIIRLVSRFCLSSFIQRSLSSASVKSQIFSFENGSSREGLNFQQIRGLFVALPPIHEQQAIARFLDFKTTQIDTLIAKKQALLDKLAEKRTALISHAVTKGLDASVPMKDSGVAWLGDIPAHWVCPPLYTRFQIELGKMLDESRITGKYLVPYLRNIDVQWDKINTQELPVMDIRPDEYSRYLVQAGDLLVCEGGDVGRAAIVSNNPGLLGYQKALHKLRAIDLNKECPRFFFFTLYWASQIGLFLADGNPNTIPHLTGEKLRRYRFPCPPFEEQKLIADWLDLQCSKIRQQQEIVSKAIDRLQEYRAALITNAVTGKIDVRDFVTPTPTEAAHA